MDFINGDARVLITKPKIAAYGLNLQMCCKQVFVGLSHSFEQTYQAIRRSWRFGQKNPVDVYIVTTDLDVAIANNVERKRQAHESMVIEMVNVMKGKTMEEIRSQTKETGIGYSSLSEKGDDWEVVNGDCVTELKRLDDDSVGLSVFSPPFASLYTYSNKDRDMGNCKDYEEFMVHGVIMMQTLFSGGSTVRGLHVEKMRGVSTNSNMVPYTIDRNGIEVYPTMSLFRDQ